MWEYNWVYSYILLQGMIVNWMCSPWLGRELVKHYFWVYLEECFWKKFTLVLISRSGKEGSSSAMGVGVFKPLRWIWSRDAGRVHYRRRTHVLCLSWSTYHLLSLDITDPVSSLPSAFWLEDLSSNHASSQALQAFPFFRRLTVWDFLDWTILKAQWQIHIYVVQEDWPYVSLMLWYTEIFVGHFQNTS